MNSKDFKVLFLYDWRSKHNAAAVVRNINAAFGNGSVSKRTFRRWYAMFETWDKSLTNDDRGRPETDMGNDVFRAIVEKIQAILLEIIQKN